MRKMAHTSEVTKTEDLIWRKELIFVPSLSRNKFSCWSANFRTFLKKTINNNRKKFRISSDQQASSILLSHSVLSILFSSFFLSSRHISLTHRHSTLLFSYISFHSYRHHFTSSDQSSQDFSFSSFSQHLISFDSSSFVTSHSSPRFLSFYHFFF